MTGAPDKVHLLNLGLVRAKLSDLISHQSRITVQLSKAEDTETKEGIHHYTIRIRGKKIFFLISVKYFNLFWLDK